MRLCQILLQIFKDLTTAKSSDQFLVIFKIVSKNFDTILRFLFLVRYAEGLDRPLCTGKPAVCTLAQQYQQDLH